MNVTHKDYFDFNRPISIIFAIIIPFSYVLGIVIRFKEKKFLASLIRLFLGWNIIYILDLVYIIMSGRIFRLLNK